MTPGLRPSPIVDHYLAARFLQPFVVALIAFSGIYVLADVFDRFEDLMRYSGFGGFGLLYFLLKVPLIVSQLMPVACLAGVLLGFAFLNRDGEVLAFQALGLSRLKLGTPVLVLAAVISLLDFGLSELVVPYTSREARSVYAVKIKHRAPKGVFANRDIWMRARDGFLSVDRYDAAHLALKGVTVFHLDPDFGLRDVRYIASADWDGKDWRLAGVRVLKIWEGGTVTLTNDDDFRLDAKPADFGLLRQDPEEFSLAELNRYIHWLRRKGVDPGGYVVDRDLKYAMPLACLIMVALGVALSLDPLPRHLSLGRGFALGVAIGFGYWVALGFTSSFGRSGLIPAWVGAWSPNVVFATLAAAIFLFGEERQRTRAGASTAALSESA